MTPPPRAPIPVKIHDSVGRFLGYGDVRPAYMGEGEGVEIRAVLPVGFSQVACQTHKKGGFTLSIHPSRESVMAPPRSLLRRLADRYSAYWGGR